MMQPYQHIPSKYDQFVQGVQAFNAQLDRTPMLNQNELIERRKVYDYYHKALDGLRKELSGLLQNARGNAAQTQYAQAMLQKIATADAILMQIEHKIENSTQRLFPKVKTSPSSAPLSKGSSVVEEGLMDAIFAFSSRLELFEKYAATQQKDKQYEKDCAEFMNDLRGLLKSLQERVGQSTQNEERALQEEMLRSAEQTLQKIAQRISQSSSSSSSANQQSVPAHAPRSPKMPKQFNLSEEASLSSVEREQFNADELINQVLGLADEIQAFEQGFLMQDDGHDELPNFGQQGYLDQIPKLREKIQKFRARLQNVEKDQIGFLEEMLASADKTLTKMTKRFEKNDAGSSTSHARLYELSEPAKFALGSKTSVEIATTPLISNPWIYDQTGHSTSGDLISKNYLCQACAEKNIQNSQRFFQVTKKVCDLFGDGCCGTYCISALLLQKAIDDVSFRKGLIERIEYLSGLWNPTEQTIEFQDGQNSRKVNKDELVRHVLNLLNSLKSGMSLEEILTKENGQLLNLFFRTALRECIQTGELDDEILEALMVEDTGQSSLKDTLIKQYKEIEAPIVYALNRLLGLDIGVIDFDGKAFRLPDHSAKDGYLIRTGQAGGHYLAAFPRS